jgi:hypothetical protein
MLFDPDNQKFIREMSYGCGNNFTSKVDSGKKLFFIFISCNISIPLYV